MKSKLEIDKGNYKGEIKNYLKEPTDLFMWEIKFPASTNVSNYKESDFIITDCNKKIFDCEIKTNIKDNSISIIPNKNYKKDTYYYLNINHNNGLYIVFRIVGETFESKTFKTQAEFNEFMKKDKLDKADNDEIDISVKNINKNKNNKEKLNYINFNYMKLIFCWTIVFLFTFVFIEIFINVGFIDFLASVTSYIMLITIPSIIIVLETKKYNSIKAYNSGVTKFNNQQYSEALTDFNKALKIDKRNEPAKKAISITEKYKT